MDLFNLDHAYARLGHSVVLYNDFPVYIVDLESTRGGGFTFWYNPLGQNSSAKGWLPGNLVHTFDLGFSNAQDGMVSVCRSPRQMYKAGLDNQNIILLSGVVPEERGLRHLNINAFLLSKPLGDTILNRYPSFKDIESQVKNVSSVAFCREFGVMSSGQLIHCRLGPVGEIKGGLPVLNGEARFLQELLETRT